MQNNSFLCRFIFNHLNDWEELLSTYPYFITVKKSEPFAIFNYNLLASEIVEDEETEETERFTCDFSLPEVQEARGIIINYQTLEVVCWPFRKFGNYGESYADEIDWQTARVQEKVDGSIMKLWYDKLNGHWQISSNKLIDASEATTTGGYSLLKLFKKAANTQKLDFDILNKDYTYIFELVSPLNRVVIKYSEIEIYHIGTRNNLTGKELVEDIGIKKPKAYPLTSLKDCIDAAAALNKDCDKFDLLNEGFVVVDGNWNRIKIKSPDYVLIHHALNGGILSKKKIINLILENEAKEYLVYYPDYEPAFNLYTKRIEILQKEISDAVKYYTELWANFNPDKKAFAFEINKDKRKGWAFNIVNYGKTAKDIFDAYTMSKLIDELDAIHVEL